jgi:uncharacterized membrane protein YoaK (UPF0700 family)
MFGLPKEGLTSFVLSLAVACTAAYVDAAGFSLYSGAYVSFMSGNTTRAGVFLANGVWQPAVLLAGVILAFVFGAAVGAMVTGVFKKRGQALILLAAGIGLGAVAVLGFYWELIRLNELPRVSLLSLAALMGMLNSAVRQVDKISVGLTYITGSLTKLGAVIGSKIINRGAGDRIQDETIVVLGSIWLAFAIGAVCGGLAAGHYGLKCVLVPAGVLAGLGGVRWRRE